jgi:hypothetical protein
LVQTKHKAIEQLQAVAAQLLVALDVSNRGL